MPRTQFFCRLTVLQAVIAQARCAEGKATLKKHRVLAVVALLSAMACASVSWAQTFTANQALVFGTFAPSAVAGTVTIPAVGIRSKSGGAYLIAFNTGAAASFSVSGGGANQPYAITLPGNGVVSLSLVGSPGTTMAVNGFSSSTSSGQLNGIGALIFTVGATLSVGSNQPVGNYTGNFEVTINLQ
ncbi:MAG: DUF4402 domain-containing protein [Polaromonas sp.]|uniref:DUF4402 domain-containing protein n=1 Tax=Polaromonas sp. TaxID=1869339 RepID=UPI002724BE8F|nr:DUF4402 domain-containing protein [Polaromonas sp.]MDO9114069.1 DUF4402 domain-containing protein [Polaromonas sp.]